MNRRGRWSMQRLTLARAFDDLASVVGRDRHAAVLRRARPSLDRRSIAPTTSSGFDRCASINRRSGGAAAMPDRRAANRAKSSRFSRRRDCPSIPRWRADCATSQESSTSRTRPLPSPRSRASLTDFQSPSGLHPSVLAALEPVSIDGARTRPASPGHPRGHALTSARSRTTAFCAHSRRRDRRRHRHLGDLGRSPRLLAAP